MNNHSGQITSSSSPRSGRDNGLVGVSAPILLDIRFRVHNDLVSPLIGTGTQVRLGRSVLHAYAIVSVLVSSFRVWIGFLLC